MGRQENESTAHLLWTGGWDSTFRLLDLASRHRGTIQPYYVIDGTRRAWRLELETMRRIEDACRNNRAAFVADISSPVVTEKDSIPQNSDITEQFWRLRRKHPHLGRQYEWLARLAHKYSIRTELGIVRGDRVYSLLRDHVELEGHPWGKTYVLRRELDGDADLALFRHFSFPLFDLSKGDTERIARERGFLRLLERSWFCHRSVNGRPCGICNPCRIAVREGMGRRVGWPGLLKYHTVARVDEMLPGAARALIRKGRIAFGRLLQARQRA